MSSSIDQDGPPLPLPPNVNSRSTKNRPANAFDIGNNVAKDCHNKRRKLIDDGIVVVHPKQNEDMKKHIQQSKERRVHEGMRDTFFALMEEYLKFVGDQSCQETNKSSRLTKCNCARELLSSENRCKQVAHIITNHYNLPSTTQQSIIYSKVQSVVDDILINAVGANARHRNPPSENKVNTIDTVYFRGRQFIVSVDVVDDEGDPNRVCRHAFQKLYGIPHQTMLRYKTEYVVNRSIIPPMHGLKEKKQ